MAGWFDSLPPAEAVVPCGGGTHTVRWTAGQLTLPAHPDAEAEMVLGALGGDKPGCVTLTETWARHAADLAVLNAGPRCAADWVIVDRDEVAEQRASLPAWSPQATSMPMASAPGGRRAMLRASGPGIDEAGGHLVIGVDEPGYPLARVQALAAPGAEPAAITVRAYGDPRAALPAWEVAATDR